MTAGSRTAVETARTYYNSDDADTFPAQPSGPGWDRLLRWRSDEAEATLGRAGFKVMPKVVAVD